MRWYHIFKFMPQLEKKFSFLHENIFRDDSAKNYRNKSAVCREWHEKQGAV